MEKIVLSREKETLLIPLYGKALDGRRKNPILSDKKAAEIISGIDYDFDSLKIPEKTNILMCIRASMMDDFARDFLKNGGIALHLGAGLDSRCERINVKNADWYDVDFKEVIDIRRNFYKETDNYHMVASSVIEPGWIEALPEGGRPALVIAEGLFMYLKEEDIKTLISRLKKKLGAYTLIFDAYSTLTAKNAARHPSIKRTGASINWGIDDPLEMTKWQPGIKFVREMYFTSGEYVEMLDGFTKAMFKMAGAFNAARKAHRILVYEIG